MANSTEKRQSPRVPLECPIHYRVVPAGAVDSRDAVVQDVSVSGFRFRSLDYVPLRSGMIIKMDLCGHAPVRMLARTVWVKETPGDGSYMVGGMFIEPPSHVRRTLGKLVSTRPVRCAPEQRDADESSELQLIR